MLDHEIRNPDIVGLPVLTGGMILCAWPAFRERQSRATTNIIVAARVVSVRCLPRNLTSSSHATPYVVPINASHPALLRDRKVKAVLNGEAFFRLDVRFDLHFRWRNVLVFRHGHRNVRRFVSGCGNHRRHAHRRDRRPRAGGRTRRSRCSGRSPDGPGDDPGDSGGRTEPNLQLRPANGAVTRDADRRFSPAFGPVPSHRSRATERSNVTERMKRSK
jgi:hypothetical protein